MGSGFHVDGIWQLTIRVPPANLVPEEYWPAAIRAASHRLHEITDGTQAIGRAWLANEFESISTADVLCIEPDINPSANPGGIGRIGMNVAMSRPELADDTGFDWWVRALVHELGHYLFGLGDEVHGGDIPDDRCVMADPRIARWCTASDHNRHADNSQNRLHHGESCRTVVDRVMGHLSRVSPDRAETRVQRITESQRFALVDARASRASAAQDPGVDGFERAVAVCRQLAASTTVVVHPVRAHSLGVTAGIELAAEWIGGAQRGSAAGILVLSDVVRDTSDLRAVIRICREQSIRVMVFAADHSDPSALAAIAEGTLGGFEVLPECSTAHYERDVEMRMVRAFCSLRNGVWLGAFEQTWLEPTVELAWDWQVEGRVETLEILVAVDPPTSICVTWQAPDGSTAALPPARNVLGWSLCSMTRPMPGRWRVSVSAPEIDRRVPFAAWSAIQNPTFGISIRGFPAVGKSGSTFPLFAYSGFSSQRPERWELRARDEEPHSPTQLIAASTVVESAPRTGGSSRGCEWCPPNRIESGYGGIDSSIPADWLGARDFELILEFRGPEGTVATRAIPFQLLVR